MAAADDNMELQLYREITGRNVWLSSPYEAWLEEFAVTGVAYAKEQMEARVTLHTHSDILDGPLPVPPPPPVPGRCRRAAGWLSSQNPGVKSALTFLCVYIALWVLLVGGIAIVETVTG